MSDEEKKPAGDPRLFITAAEAVGMTHDFGAPPTPGLSRAPGLLEVPNSKVPSGPGGALVSHVYGPGQAPVDPVAAGLDTAHKPITRQEDRVFTLTGTDGAGPRPSTYGVDTVAQSAPNSHELVAAPKNADIATSPGPNSIVNPDPKPAADSAMVVKDPATELRPEGALAPEAAPPAAVV